MHEDMKGLPFEHGYIDGITILNLEGEILFSAKFNAKLSNLDESQQLVGQRFLDVYENLTPESSTLYRAMQTGGPVYEERQCLKRVGKDTNHITSFSIPIRRGERIVGAVDLSCQQGTEQDLPEEGRYEIALTKDRLRANRTYKLVAPMRAVYEYDDIIAVNPAMKSARDYIKIVAGCDLPAMLCGEVGVGKELFAHAIHNASARREGPFLTQNCTATPGPLLENMLFGTPASVNGEIPESKGVLELAKGGTIYLEEIDAMPQHLQYRLLRILREQKPDVRMLVSLNRPPKDCIADGTLRQDVYYFLGALSIFIPPLRERQEDIPYFLEAYVEKYNAVFRKKIRYISRKLIAKLQSYHWPGNTGELEQAVIYGMSMVNSQSETLRFSDLQGRYPLLDRTAVEHEGRRTSLHQSVSCYEKELIRQALVQTGGNITEAARILDIPRQTLQRKIRQYQIKKNE